MASRSHKHHTTDKCKINNYNDTHVNKIIMLTVVFITSETENSATQTRLTQKDLVNVLKLLQSHSYQWKLIGLSLGFIDPELTTISNMHRLFMGAPTSYLQELLSQWVQWPTASHPTKPTLEALCAALRSSLVGLGSLADKVNEEMRQNTGMTQLKYIILQSS